MDTIGTNTSTGRLARGRVADAAREHAAASPSAQSDGNPLRRFAQKILLRLGAPWATHQRGVNTRLIDAVDRLEARVAEQERLQLEHLTADLTAALEALRARVAAVEASSGERDEEPLDQLDDSSLGALSYAAPIDDISDSALLEFLRLAHEKLRPGGVFVAAAADPNLVVGLSRQAGFESAHVVEPHAVVARKG